MCPRKTKMPVGFPRRAMQTGLPWEAGLRREKFAPERSHQPRWAVTGELHRLCKSKYTVIVKDMQLLGPKTATSESQSGFQPIGMEQKVQSFSDASDMNIRILQGMDGASLAFRHRDSDPCRLQHLAVILSVADRDHFLRAQFFYVVFLLKIMVHSGKNIKGAFHGHQFGARQAKSIRGYDMYLQDFRDLIYPLL